MSLEYAPKGLIGSLAPQANTTIEPELAILLPPGYAAINGRLVSGHPGMEERSVEYFRQLEPAARQFANAPLKALAFACTGTAYLIGAEAEDRGIEQAQQRLGYPVITAATAIVSALQTLGAERIGLVSPYSGRLNQACAPYWQSRGFDVVAKTPAAARDDGSFHPIYSLSSADAERALGRIAEQDLDAVLLLGTGMPTLAAIRNRPRVGSAVVLSSMLCLGWRSVVAAGGLKLVRQDLLDWVGAKHWGDRLRH